MDDDPVGQQVEVAIRFVRRLIALVDAGVIYPPSHQAPGYPEAVTHVGRLILTAGSDSRDARPGPARRLAEFTRQADHELQRAGLRGELLDAASTAVRGILTRRMAGALPSALLVHQPFEFKIPYDSLV
jgi:hypothetical protein